MEKIFKLVARAVILILCVANLPATAADYPTKPITIIVQHDPGGAGDVQARAFASAAEKLLGQPVLVINKPGAAGMIGLEACKQAAPDGYTLVLGSNVFLLPIEWEITNGRKPLVTRDDFITIGAFTRTPLLITVPYNSPWKTLGDLIE